MGEGGTVCIESPPMPPDGAISRQCFFFFLLQKVGRLPYACVIKVLVKLFFFFPRDALFVMFIVLCRCLHMQAIPSAPTSGFGLILHRFCRSTHASMPRQTADRVTGRRFPVPVAKTALYNCEKKLTKPKQLCKFDSMLIAPLCKSSYHPHVISCLPLQWMLRC